MVISRNLVVFALAGLAMLAARHIPLPGIDLNAATGNNGGNISVASLAQVSVATVGLEAIYVALMLFELVRLFVVPRDRDQERPTWKAIMLVRLLALGIAAAQAFRIAYAIEANGFVRPDFTVFIPVAIACGVAMTAFFLFLIERIRLDGFANGFWALFAIDIAYGLPIAAWQTWELMRTGALAFELVLYGFVFAVACIAAILFVISLWHRLAADEGDGGKTVGPLSREILIWPIALSFFVVGTVLTDLPSVHLDLFIGFDGLNSTIVFHGLAILLIPLFVFGYARRSWAQVDSTVGLYVVAALISFVQMALVGVALASYLLPWTLFLPDHFRLIALVLTAVGIGALRVPALFPESDIVSEPDRGAA